MISFGFSTQKKNIVSRIIRWLTKSRASHAWLLIDDTLFGTQLVMEASEWGIRLIPYKSFEQKNIIVRVVQPKAPLEPGIRSAAMWLGNTYDFTGLFGMFWVYLGRAMRKRWRNPVHSSKAMFCSEFVVRVAQASAYPGAAKLDPDSTSPEDLLQFLEG